MFVNPLFVSRRIAMLDSVRFGRHHPVSGGSF